MAAEDSMEGSREDRIKKYYALRAEEYDLVYEKPDRQEDLKKMKEDLVKLLSGKRVLEIACGTGYWTEVLAPANISVHAVDASAETLSVAGRRTASLANITYGIADAYKLEGLSGQYDGAFCGYWISHVSRARMKGFMKSLSSKLLPGSTVVLLDNKYVDGSSTPVSSTDSEGNTYQVRTLLNGGSFEIMKNFLDRRELEALSEGVCQECHYIEYQYYWMFSCRTT